MFVTPTLCDRLGRPLKPMMRPEYRRGVTPPNAGLKYPAEVLTREEVGKLLAACSRRGKAGIRNRAIITTGWRCGLRSAETLGLEPRDVDLDAGELLVRHGKGDKSRRLGLDAEAVAILHDWLEVRRRLSGVPPRSGPFFCTITSGNQGEPVSGSYVRGLMTALGQKAGIEKRVHYHGLRHTFAVNMLREGKTLLVIQKALGHSDLATTYRYLNHLFPGEVIDAMRDRPWDEQPQQTPDLLAALGPEQVAQLVSLVGLLEQSGQLQQAA